MNTKINKPYKIYAEVLDGQALDQFYSAMRQDFVTRGALMPDSHTGYSLPIGAAVATKGVVVPAWVGYDLGCGMSALKTTFSLEDVKSNATKIYNRIYEVVPVGKHQNDKKTKSSLDQRDLTEIGNKAFTKRGGFHALGSLGGGNHFIEIGKDEDDYVWIIIHSGSRGPGHGTATEYMKLAANSTKPLEGHFCLEEDSELGKKYINDLKWYLNYALENRKVMIQRVEAVLAEVTSGSGLWDDNFINRNHNHADKKGEEWIHRKGATHAEEGMKGVIPGNMRDGSFIVTGKGNEDSLCSSSHGAGRVLSRRQAKRELSIEDFAATMKDITAKVEEKTLDESPFAYKDIFDVMRLQEDLISVDHHVKPIINIKG